MGRDGTGRDGTGRDRQDRQTDIRTDGLFSENIILDTKQYSKCFFNQSLLELYPIRGQTSFCILEVLLLNGLKEDKQLLLHLHYLWNEVLMYTYLLTLALCGP